jgi:hypothetical protein
MHLAAITIDRDAITLAIAVTGCLVGVSGLVLGIYNLRRAIAKDKVSVTVTPKYYLTPTGERGIWLEIVNTGFVPTTITQAGFNMADGRVFLATERHEFDRGAFGEMLAPQARLSLHFKIGADLSDDFKGMVSSFVTTAAGEQFLGDFRPRKDDVTIHRYG